MVWIVLDVCAMLPSNISTHKNNTTTHDDKKWLQSFVMLQALGCESLHAGGGVVQLPAPGPHQVGVVSSS